MLSGLYEPSRSQDNDNIPNRESVVHLLDLLYKSCAVLCFLRCRLQVDYAISERDYYDIVVSIHDPDMLRSLKET